MNIENDTPPLVAHSERREFCGCTTYGAGQECGMVVCWKCEQIVSTTVEDGGITTEWMQAEIERLRQRESDAEARVTAGEGTHQDVALVAIKLGEDLLEARDALAAVDLVLRGAKYAVEYIDDPDHTVAERVGYVVEQWTFVCDEADEVTRMPDVHSESGGNAVVEGFLRDVEREVRRAQAKWPGMNSAHEAYAVILEEVEEFWIEVRKKQTDYDLRAMYDELVQIAAMAARAAGDVIYPSILAAAGQGGGL